MKHAEYIWTDGTWTYSLKIRKTEKGYEGRYEGSSHPAITPDSVTTCSGNTIDEVLEKSAKELLHRRDMRVVWKTIVDQ